MRRVKPPSTIQKVTRFDEESIRAKDRDVDSGQSDQAGQDDDETDKTVAEDASAGAKVLDLDGTELGVLKGGIVYWHALCEKCSSRKKPSCRGRQGHACDACRKGGYKCSYASHGKARQRPPLPPVQSNRKRRGIDPPDESPTPTSSQARDSGGSEKRARYDLGLKPINPTSSAMNAARARGYNFDSSLAKPASRLSRPNALADDSMSWGGQDDDGSHMAFSSSGSSQQDGEVSKNYLLTATTSTFEETGDVVGEIKLLRGEMDAVKAALKREGDRVSDQRDHSAMLQKQVANLTLEVEALRRMIQRMEDGR
ncbi:hypothetical protein BOTBODRAFT_38339 [Botryobasidium botryosum FD-172 SS1]|uniref:Zn(2)-C6 fungal-type domain-containing protein n=1 Tax=Botryobasidium botryosum (strain FD-172 SS1) TaxID=930990 RepID=A0A067LX98_BOTB1|nr:hypothetical protein BOTBODRAFT_38339 [Botryobasidium botryosum FD-172 SS1]